MKEKKGDKSGRERGRRRRKEGGGDEGLQFYI